ncbi:hypothetical protein [Chitinimonas naiadis]
MLTELDRFDLWPQVPTCEDYGHFHQVRAIAPGPDSQEEGTAEQPAADLETLGGMQQ